MPSEHPCFLLVPVGDVEVSLRRYERLTRDRPPTTCSAPKRPKFPGDAFPSSHGYHNAEVVIGREPGPLTHTTLDPGNLISTTDQPAIDVHDPRWPTHCECGYAFLPTDNRQTERDRLYRRADCADGELVTIDKAPVGAMWQAVWYAAFGEKYHRHAPDECLEIRTPAGNWIIDGPANNGDGWTRTGTIPMIVVRPSIGIGVPVQRMHGWLGGPAGDRPGVLVIDTP